MASDPDFDSLVEPLRADNISGASELSGVAADVIRRAAVRLKAGSVDELRWGLGQVCQEVLDAQPSMAPLVTLVRLVLAAVEGASAVEDARLAAANAAEAFGRGSDDRVRAVVAAAAEVLPPGGTVATLSSSGTVQALLSSEAGPRGIRVICFESRPMREGRRLAETLAGKGVEVTFAVDAAMDALGPECDAILLGTDSVGDQGVVNKIGSVSLARSGRAAGVPVYVLADETKLLPRGYPQITEDDRSGGEVWEEAPEGVNVWNRYFEIVPGELVTGVVGEEGLLTPAAVDERRSRLELPAGIRAWAVRRAESRAP
ncbi:MAG: hypothetical protein R3253_09920 [Longimicrobiales bacterium]|nr:hypothetical protein [Longimicrobiales bacterium]